MTAAGNRGRDRCPSGLGNDESGSGAWIDRLASAD